MRLEWALFRKNWGGFFAVFSVWLLYGYFTYSAPVSQSSQALQLSEFSVRLLQLSVAIPYLIIWLLVAYGVLQLDTYRRYEEDGVIKKSFSYVVAGVALLGTSTIIGPLIGAVRSYMRTRGTEETFRVLTILVNYVYIILPLAAFILLLYGISRFGGNKRIFTKENVIVVVLLLLVIAVLYVPLVFTNTSRNVPVSPEVTATYFLSDGLIIATIIIPLFISWGLGLLSVLTLNDVQIVRQSPMTRRGMKHFMFGIWFIIISTMLLQSLLSLGGTRLLALGLGLLLLLVYQFLALEGIGFLYIASGARKFARDRLSETTQV